MSHAERIARMLGQERGRDFVLSTKPEDWPTLDELPQADTTDMEQAYQYQSTVDSDFEL